MSAWFAWALRSRYSSPIIFCGFFQTYPEVKEIIVFVPYLVAFGYLQKNWICDVYWLLHSNDAKFGLYLKELKDEVVPEPDHSCLMKLFYRCRNLVETLPHEGVCTRLRPSKIHGVGVFAIKDISEGSYLFTHDDQPIVWIERKDIEKLPIVFKQFYDDFGIIKGDKYGCPQHFDSLTTSWYLNESADPNVAADEDYRFYALRDIKADEELTVDYSTYSDEPQ